MKTKRNRLHYAILAAVVIVTGCASRCYLSNSWPPFLVEYAGDTLWALMLFLGLGFLFPSLSTAVLAASVLLFSFGVEFSQLYQARWLNSFRQTLLGAVTIGDEFRWSDFACYTAGCGLGVIGELTGRALTRKQQYSNRGKSASTRTGLRLS